MTFDPHRYVKTYIVCKRKCFNTLPKLKLSIWFNIRFIWDKTNMFVESKTELKLLETLIPTIGH